MNKLSDDERNLLRYYAETERATHFGTSAKYLDALAKSGLQPGKRFDLSALKVNLDVDCAPVYCTKIAAKLVRTFTDRHGLKDLCKELLGIDLSKQQQSSDWGAPNLSDEQLRYAASDVLHLHALRDRLDAMLAREGREALARASFEFLPHRVLLDLEGWSEQDIFAH